ncbi:TPA: FRG domain-containing protein [Vibrio parahaemolyticus]
MNLAEFFEHLANEANVMLPGRTDQVWYRGHSNFEYQLVPTIHRREGINEAGLFYEYKAHVAAINGCTKDDWDTLLDMQHYGLPTRLLDWTNSLGTALYFALKGAPSSPCIWMLNPYKLSFESTGDSIIYDTTRLAPGSASYSSNYDIADMILGRTEINKPFAIQPPHGNRRIAAQRGRFTVHTQSKEAIESQCPDCVKQFEIPSHLVAQLKTILQMLGIDDYSQFPDQYGLSEYLRGQFALA